MARRALDDDAIERHLSGVAGWERRGDRIAKRFRFDDFVAAFGWMASAAIVADKMDHHPEWRNVYATVEVELTTHDAGGGTKVQRTRSTPSTVMKTVLKNRARSPRRRRRGWFVMRDGRRQTCRRGILSGD